MAVDPHQVALGVYRCRVSDALRAAHPMDAALSARTVREHERGHPIDLAVPPEEYARRVAADMVLV